MKCTPFLFSFYIFYYLNKDHITIKWGGFKENICIKNGHILNNSLMIKDLEITKQS